jgi:hypothetical protein
MELIVVLIQNFYNGQTAPNRQHIDVVAGGAFFSVTVANGMALIEKIISNQGWNDEHVQPRQRGMHTVKKTDMLVAKLDLLLKRLDAHNHIIVCG